MKTLTSVARCMRSCSSIFVIGLISLGLTGGTMAAAPSVTSFTLVNATTDKPIVGYDPMPEGVILDFTKLGTNKLNIRANTNPNPTGSVKFGYDTNATYHIENASPYAIAGNNGPDYFAWTPTNGKHTVTATAYPYKSAGGTPGAMATLHFSVGDLTPPSVPTGLVVSGITTSSFKVTWNPSTDNIGVTGYDVSINNGTPVKVTGTSYTASGLQAGTAYAFKVRSRDAAGNISAYSAIVSITTSAPTNVAPTITISSSASSFTAPASITFTANASDSDGTITQVEYFNGSTSIGKSTVSPYSVTWSSVGAGTYSITGKATDNSSTATTSAAISITIAAAPNVLPTVSMTSPASGSSFTAGANITLSANAADSDGTIAHVDFYNGTTLLNSDTTAPYSYTWNAVPAGSYSLKAIAYDNTGGKTDSAIITIKVTSTTTTDTTPLVGYFVSSSTGSDSYTATQAKNASTPWKTLAKVNSISFVAGDKIYFKRGDTFTGTLIPKTSGTSTAPITFDAYGTGEKPIISNLVDPRSIDTNTTDHGWKPYTGTGIIAGVYYVELASMPTYGPSVLTFNAVGAPKVLTPKGRYPKADYRTCNLGTPITTTSSTGTTTTSYKNFIDAETTKLPASPSWVGAVFQVRGSGQDSHRSRISAYNATTGSISLVSSLSSGYLGNGKGYLLYDHVNLFNSAFASGSNAPAIGDWAWVPGINITSGTTSGRLYVYFGTNGPSAYEVKIGKPSIKENLYLDTKTYVNVNNLTFEGSGMNGVSVDNSTSCTVRNCEIRFAQTGVGYSGTPVNCTVQNNYIHDMTGNGLRLFGTNWKILDNLITDIGLSVNTGDSVGNSQGSGMVIGAHGEGYRIHRNKISNCALHGMWLGVVNDIQVYYNRIENWGDGKDDCGAIYAWDGYSRVTDTTHHDRYIRGNVVLNGNAKGEHKGDVSGAGHGIYLDLSNKWVVEDNYVENLKGNGLLALDGDDHQVRRNIFKKCSTVGNQGGFFFREGATLLHNLTVENNVILSGNKSPIAGNRVNSTPGYTHFGLFQNNYYRTTLAAGNACVLDYSNRTWNFWLTQPIEAGHIALDLGSTMALENNVAGAVVTYYNNTNAPTTITLPTSSQYKNLITGTYVSGSIVLQPYQSVALAKM